MTDEIRKPPREMQAPVLGEDKAAPKKDGARAKTGRWICPGKKTRPIRSLANQPNIRCRRFDASSSAVAFLLKARKRLNARYGIAEAAALLGCSNNRICMAEKDWRLPPPHPRKTYDSPGYSI